MRVPQLEMKKPELNTLDSMNSVVFLAVESMIKVIMKSDLLLCLPDL